MLPSGGQEQHYREGWTLCKNAIKGFYKKTT